MKKVFIITLAFTIVVSLCGVVMASMKTLEFPGGGAGKVIFDGKKHNQRLGPGKCAECHGKGIPYKAPGAEGALKTTMADIYAGKDCGLCHNGTRAFSAKDKGNCGKCHQKK